MNLFFTGDMCGLEEGVGILSQELGFTISPDGLAVTVECNPGGELEVRKNGKNIIIRFSKRIHFFRALGLLVESLQEGCDFSITEEPQFDMNGAMFDVSQGNAVINVENIKKLLLKMAVMGLNMLMLYVEDSYEIKDEPYFGYMRGRYAYEELKECDDFADIFGIEMIPCMQTLAHLIDALKWQCYSDIKDDDDTLLVGYDKTYEFIEKMILAASAPFRSKRIHIGMDEAWKLGQGKYLLLNGYKDKFEIMTEHLKRVVGITTKYGLEPLIWSDMYFRAASKSGRDYYDKESIISKDIIDLVPDEVRLVYWDYYHFDEEFYFDWIQRHRAFGSQPVFAGAVYSWSGFCAHYHKTFAVTHPALNACKKEGIREVFVTVWGDGGTESNIYSNLLGLQLYAEHGYTRELDLEKLKKRFKFCTGANYDDFMDITYLDKLPGTDPEGHYSYNPCKYLLWQDILSGLFDKNIEGLSIGNHYESIRKRMEGCIASNGEFGFLFEFLEKLCSVLSLKAEMGLNITCAYKNGDYGTLRDIAEHKLPELLERVIGLRRYHRELWMRINKPLGWEVLDIRYGGLVMRIDTAVDRLTSYLQGKIGAIEELEQEKLYFSGEPGLTYCNVYNRMPTASRISFSYGF